MIFDANIGHYDRDRHCVISRNQVLVNWRSTVDLVEEELETAQSIQKNDCDILVIVSFALKKTSHYFVYVVAIVVYHPKHCTAI